MTELLSMLVVGLIVGWLASRLLGVGGYGLVGDIVVGVIGSFAGWWLTARLLAIDVTGINATGITLAVAGAIVALKIFRALVPGRRGLGRFIDW